MNRRDLIKSAAAISMGLTAGSAFAIEIKEKRNAKNLIFINLKGGPSQLELFDAKPRSFNSGPTRCIKTHIKDLYFNKTLPALSELSKNMAVFRMSSPEKDHKRGQYFLQSGGHRPLSSLTHPGLSSIVGWSLGKNKDLPGAVAVGSFQDSGYLGSEHTPFGIENLTKTTQILQNANKEKQRIEKLDALKNEFYSYSKYSNHTAFNNARTINEKALKLSLNEEFTKAITSSIQTASSSYCPNMEGNSASSILESDEFLYNDSNSDSFVAQCNMAGNLVKLGIPSIQLELSGWDTHKDNFTIHNGLTIILNSGVSALVESLKKSGNFDSTLIYISGEFGRTPRINKNEGREDYSDIFSSCLISGCIKNPQVFGETSRNGEEIKDAVSISQVSATILSMMGIKAEQEIVKDNKLIPLKGRYLTIS